MDKKKLSKLDSEVTGAKAILKEIEELNEVAKSCRSEVGYMRITTMYGNDGQRELITILGHSSKVHETFREAIGAAAEARIKELEAEFKTLEIK